MAYGGKGVGRRGDGKVVFIPEVIPGETVAAYVVKEHTSYVEANLKELFEASQFRVKAPCPYFTICGGCDWQHIVYPEQIAIKQEILKSQIQVKNPNTELCFEEPVISSKEYGYRCHAVVQCTNVDGFEVGFFRKRSNAVVPIKRCLILNERCQTVMDQMSEMLRTHPISDLCSLEIHAPQDEVLVQVIMKGRPLKNDVDFLRRVYLDVALSGLSYFPKNDPGRRRIFGQRVCSYEIALYDKKVSLASSFGGFIQANMEVNQELVACILDCATGSHRLLDLYSGSGNFGIPLSSHVDEVLAVEQDPDLVKAGAAIARENGCRNIRFLNEEAAITLRWLEQEGVTFDIVVLDPPREGARDVVRTLSKMKIGRIVYISCNPSTLARDLAVLIQEGFRLKSIRYFDMFPQTFHIESVSVLER
jgi:23S rRNA (uracil1939-C5)-methyltransferase